MCLDASSGEGNDGDAIILWSCHGEANQRWGLSSAGELRGINDKCIDLRGSARSGTALVLQSCSGRASQTWNAPTTGTVASAPPQDSTPASSTSSGLYPDDRANP